MGRTVQTASTRWTRRSFLRGAGSLLIAGGAVSALDPLRVSAQEFDPYWVQNTQPTQLWSGPGPAAETFSTAPPESYFRVVQAQAGPRLHVWNPVTENYCYVDALAVGPVDAPPPEAIMRQRLWVATLGETLLWSAAGPQSAPLGRLGPGEVFEMLAEGGTRLQVRDPFAREIAYLNHADVGTIDLKQPPTTPSDSWRGSIASGANLRAEPNTQSPIVGQIGQRAPLVVTRWVAGEEVFPDQPSWAQLADRVYVYSPLLRPAPVEAPPRLPSNAPAAGRWIDANLTHQVVVAYDGRTPVFQSRFSSGRPAWETSTGVLRVLWRVAKETMDSATLVGMDAARANYRVEDIKWAQYFTNDGQAIHHNYWRDPDLFGIPSSHGCLGMLEADAKRIWDWAPVGTPLVIHYEAAT